MGMDALKARRRRLGLSQRELARRAKVSFRTIQLIESGGHDPRWSTLCCLATTLGVEEGKLDSAVAQCLAPEDDSIESVSRRIIAEGSASWKTWLFEFVDAFSREPDGRLAESPPAAALSPRLKALLASTTELLCARHDLSMPLWCSGVGPLDTPWFPAETENLKASALVEAPAQFRRRNIFVLGNFLARA